MSNNVQDLLSPGDRVDIQTVSELFSEDTDETKYYISKVYDIDENGNISILMPMEKFKMILLQIGEEYDLFFYTKKGVFTCRGKVIDRTKDDNVYSAIFYCVTDLVKRQRREYYRYDCVIGMNSRRLDDNENKLFFDYKEISMLAEPHDKSVIVDISGGGLRFVSAEKYEIGDLILCRFILNMEENSKKYDVVLRVLSHYPVVNNPKNTEYRGQFLFIEDRIRDNIVKYIFEEERRLRRRR